MHLRLDVRNPKTRETIEHPAADEHPERARREEALLGDQHHDQREACRAILGQAGATVLGDRQPDLFDRGPDGIELGIEEEPVPPVQAGEHDAAQAVFLRPVHVGNGLVDIGEVHAHLAPAPLRQLGAEVGEPPLVGAPSLGEKLRIGAASGIVERVLLERHAVGEQDFRDHTDRLEALHPKLRVPLHLDPDVGVHVSRIGYAMGLGGLHLLVVDLEVLALDVVAIALPRGLDVTVNRDDRRTRHRCPPVALGMALPATTPAVAVERIFA